MTRTSTGRLRAIARSAAPGVVGPLTVDEADARQMTKRLAREEGLLVSTSSGLNIAAAVQLAHESGPGTTVTTVVVDTGLKYLAGDLFTT